MNKSCFIVIVLMVCCHCAIAASAAEKPESIVWKFYEYHFTHDMGFTRETLAARKQWLAPDLMAAAQTYFARPENPDEVPAIDGDPFTDTQEYPDRYDVDKPELSKGKARIPVTFYWKDVNQPRSVTVVLTQSGEHWLISDVEYPESNDSLMKLLQ